MSIMYHQDLWEVCAIYKQIFLLFTTQFPSLTLHFMKDSNCFQKEMTTIEKQEHARIASNYKTLCYLQIELEIKPQKLKLNTNSAKLSRI